MRLSRGLGLAVHVLRNKIIFLFFMKTNVISVPITVGEGGVVIQ